MSHDCDCSDCMDTDSRWAPYRETQRALKEDCPRGKHVADLVRAGSEGTEYKCRHCGTPTDAKGKDLWMRGKLIVEYRCGVRVMKSGEKWGHGDVYRVYQKDYFYGKDGGFEYEWKRDSRLFTYDRAIEAACDRVRFAENGADANPLDRQVWATATLRKTA